MQDMRGRTLEGGSVPELENSEIEVEGNYYGHTQCSQRELCPNSNVRPGLVEGVDLHSFVQVVFYLCSESTHILKYILSS